MSGFCAKSLLIKQGWEDGGGLGKNELGMKDAIQVTNKQDTCGVGHDPGKVYTFHWWDHAFNQAADNLRVEHDSDGEVTVKMYKKTRKEKSTDAKNRLYANFVKPSLLTSDDGKTRTKSDSEDEEDASNRLTDLQRCTDEQLLEICGGRTAHKGARHGLKASGKLARIKEQERLFLLSMQAEEEANKQSGSEQSNESLSKKKKKKKSKEAVLEIDESVSKKKKKKSKQVEEEEVDELNTKSKKKKLKEADIESDESLSKKKKSKKTEKNSTSKSHNESITDDDSSSKKKKKSKKRKRSEDDSSETDDVIVKKKKKKSKK